MAFFAGQSANYGPVLETCDFVFDNLVTNVGSGYSQNTGRFTAPVSATYQFNVAISAQERQKVRTNHKISAPPAQSTYNLWRYLCISLASLIIIQLPVLLSLFSLLKQTMKMLKDMSVGVRVRIVALCPPACRKRRVKGGVSGSLVVTFAGARCQGPREVLLRPGQKFGSRFLLHALHVNLSLETTAGEGNAKQTST